MNKPRVPKQTLRKMDSEQLASDIVRDYRGGEMPLPQYAVLVGIFAASLAAFVAAAK
jgi:hypothetical protein